MVSGTGLNAVTAARLASTPSQFTLESASRLRLIIPAGAASGRVELTAPGGVALSASNFTISTGTPIPVAISLSSASVTWGGRVTVNGASLDQASQARLGATVLTTVSRSAASLVLEVPTGAASDFLTLVDSGGRARQSALYLQTLEPMAVTAVSHSVVARGQRLTISGAHLDRATRVIFGGGAQAAIQSRSAGSSLSILVPVAAADGPVTAFASTADTAISPMPLRVVDSIVVTPAIYNLPIGGPFTIFGSGLDAVTLATLDGAAAAISSRSDNHVELMAPVGVDCARITLWSVSQDPVVAGSVVVGGGCIVRAAGLDFAQLMSRPDTDTWLPMVPGKETWVRAYVVSDFSAIAAPAMRAVGYLGNTRVGAVSLNGPAILPLLPASAAVPSSLREDDAATYNAELPASWVASGLRVQIEIDPLPPTGTTKSLDSTPPMGSEAAIELVLVPLVSGGNVPVMPSIADVVDEISRRLPVPRERILVSQRAAHTLGSVVNGVDTPADWSAAIAELENLRIQEAPDKQYYGMVRPVSGTGISGIGYVNSIGSSSPNLSALGWDIGHGGWRRTMIHELGHNYGRWHSPCGNPAGIDSEYPYAGGVLGPTPLFDSLTNRVIASLGLTDVMGYCNGSWFSDYNLREVKRFLEAQPQPAFGLTAAPATEVLIVSGVIDNSGARLAPVRSARMRVAPRPSGRNLLRLITRDGLAIDKPFTLAEVDHAQDENHFLVEIANPGEIAAIEILRDGRKLPLVSAQMPTLPQLSSGVSVAVDGPWVASAINDGRLEVTWNAQVSTYATVTLVLDGTRRILALNARGGQLAIPSATLPKGGMIEVSLSDGLNATLVTLPRP